MSSKIIKVNIDDIVIDNRIRKDLGDLQELTDDIRIHGLMNFPLISNDMRLIAGERRVQACKMLGFSQITVRQTDINDAEILTEMEISENLLRKDFTKSERVDCCIRLERIEKIKAEKRMKAGKANPGQNSDVGSSTGRSDDIAAKRFGISRDTYRKEKAIVENRDKLSDEDFKDWDCGRLSTNKAFAMIMGTENQSPDRKKSVRQMLGENSSLHDINEEINRLHDLRYLKLKENGAKFTWVQPASGTRFEQVKFGIVYIEEGTMYEEYFFEVFGFNIGETPAEAEYEKTPKPFWDDLNVIWTEAYEYMQELAQKFTKNTTEDYQDDQRTNEETSFSNAEKITVDRIPANFVKRIADQLIHKFHEDAGGSKEDCQNMVLLRKYLKQQWGI